MKLTQALPILVCLLCGLLGAATPIPPEVKKSVVFIFASPNGQELVPQGTGFLVGVDIPNRPDRMQVYMVTAKHVIEDAAGSLLAKIWIRVNLKTGGSTAFPITLVGSNRPYFHPRDRDVDIAVIPLALNEEKVDFLVLPDGMLVAKSEIGQPGLREGADIFFTGMFRHYMGFSRNIPIVRFGRLALVTEEKIPWQERGKPPQLLELYLIETTAFGGNSGAPVFLYLGPDSFPGQLRLGIQIKLIGVVKGHYNEGAEIGVAQQNVSLHPFAVVNSGIAAVVPAYLLREILYGDELVKERVRIAESLSRQ